jgi:hypothetical protein
LIEKGFVMILNSAPQAEAILSNVGEIGEFRIRNSAKAFNILSSGLYANKIKAIIRELSCNAIDSHTAAGTTQPFEVHLPTTLEPWFSIRDFGTGLSHDQVTKIYTTYFESTKTESNEFIGALGLGSKSPFSYTDNFTVTAIQNGRKGIYSAFINDVGVPSIALMGEEAVSESNGVEVKFSVNDRYDFSKFTDEAVKVYRWFPVLPTITGNTINIERVEYETKNIIPGVHSVKSDRYNRTSSIAVMGNIAYPIEVPQAEQSLEGVHQLLKCGLVLEFGIGELDFQASREGLSYIPLTIDSIRKKLVAVNAALTKVLTAEADVIEGEWERSKFLYNKKHQELWQGAVLEYVTNTGFALFDVRGAGYHSFDIKADLLDLKAMNIHIKQFESERGNNRCKNRSHSVSYDKDQKRIEYFNIEVDNISMFVENDCKTGSFERAKHHFRNKEKNTYRENVFVLDKLDKTKPMNLVAFYTMLHNPPAVQRMAASTLNEKPRKNGAGNGFGKNVTILQLDRRGGHSNRSASQDFVWRAADTLDKFDKTEKFYYVPLLGFVPQFTKLRHNVDQLKQLLNRTEIDELKVNVYGVRKGDIETIKKMPNWINLEEHISTTVNNLNTKIGMATVMERLDKHDIFNYNYQTVIDGVDVKSPAKAFLDGFVGLPKLKGIHWLQQLMRAMQVENNVDVEDLLVQYKQKLADFSKRYPLLDKLSSYANEGDVCEYINLVDTVKGV